MQNILFISSYRKYKKENFIALQVAKKIQGEIFYWSYIKSEDKSFIDENTVKSREDYKEALNNNFSHMQFVFEECSRENVRIIPLLTESITIKALKEYIYYNNIDFIIIEEENMKDILYLFEKHKPEYESNYSERPVLIISNTRNSLSVNNILVNLNYHQENFIKFKVLKSFADAYESKIHLLYVINPAKNSINQALISLEQLAERFKLNNYSTNAVANESVETGIKNFSSRRNADIIALLGYDQSELIRINYSLQELISSMHSSIFQFMKI